MKISYLLFPLIAAVLGWIANWLAIKFLFYPKSPLKILGFHIQGYFPKKQNQIAEKLGAMISKDFFSFAEIEKKISNPGNIEKLMPQVEPHIDHFLRVKLAEEMPMISIFIGDKTINQMKSIFIKELQNLFPVIMENYMKQLEQDIDIEKMVVEKLSQLPSDKMETWLQVSLKNELAWIKMFGAFIGFIIGSLLVLMCLLS